MLMPALAAILALSDTNAVPCDGRRVEAVAVNAQRPAFQGTASRWRTFARAMGLHHVTTRADVIRAFAFIEPGDICTAKRLSETARVLRSLPFLANANVKAVPVDSSGVAVEIETTDEVPVLAAGALRHSVPSAFSLGNENIFGYGTSVNVGIANNSPYRTSGFVNVGSYGMFGDLTLTSATVGIDRLGSHVDFGVSRLLLSDLQRFAWNATVRDGDDFPIIIRPLDDDQTVKVHDRRWSIGAIVRANVGSIPLLVGPVALGSSLSPGSTTLVISDKGPVTQQDSVLLQRFQPFHATRLGALVGARGVRFVTRTGFDALFAPQDLMVGWQVGTLVAPGLTNANNRDVLFAPSIYLGGATRRGAVLADFEGESRRRVSQAGAAATIGNLHATGYFKPDSRLLFTIDDNFSMIDGAAIPTQLTMSDPLGGPRGFGGSTIVGGRRDVLRLEARFARPNVVRHADLGLALFADHGWMMAGDVPYGQTATGQSYGFSILASYPTRSKRTYRIDVAFPTGGLGLHGVQVRFINGDPTSNFAVEPSDVTQARLAPVPSSLFTWPGR